MSQLSASLSACSRRSSVTAAQSAATAYPASRHHTTTTAPTPCAMCHLFLLMVLLLYGACLLERSSYRATPTSAQSFCAKVPITWAHLRGSRGTLSSVTNGGEGGFPARGEQCRVPTSCGLI